MKQYDHQPPYRGELEGFPQEIVERMLCEQEKQGNERDISVFEINVIASAISGGFTWGKSVEGGDFWFSVTMRRNFDIFFGKYPKEAPQEKEDKLTNFEVCLNWLKTQDKEAADYYEKNADRRDVNSVGLWYSLYTAFYWENTPQKLDFWINLSIKWYSYVEGLEPTCFKVSEEVEDILRASPYCKKDTPQETKESIPQTEQDFKTLLDAFWSDYRDFLLEKDSKYGSLYLNPLNKLIELTPKQRILSRLEEKLGRLLNGNLDDNTLDDVLGLLIHLKVVERRENK